MLGFRALPAQGLLGNPSFFFFAAPAFQFLLAPALFLLTPLLFLFRGPSGFFGSPAGGLLGLAINPGRLGKSFAARFLVLGEFARVTFGLALELLFLFGPKLAFPGIQRVEVYLEEGSCIHLRDVRGFGVLRRGDRAAASASVIAGTSALSLASMPA